jgi:hypothetical protein
LTRRGAAHTLLREMSLEENYAAVQERIARACGRARRDPATVTLVAVTKTFPAEAILAAHALGIRHFGENRVQEWESKQPALAHLDATWRLIGHLQSNKARRALQLFHAIDSVDSIELARRLDRIRAEAPAATPLPVLLEVRLAPEDTKTGIVPEELPAVYEAVRQLPRLALRGLMCIPPFFDHPEEARPYFRRLRELRDALRARFALSPEDLPELSMGMSGDFEVAIEEGATHIRLGTALFGERSRP